MLMVTTNRNISIVTMVVMTALTAKRVVTTKAVMVAKIAD